MNNTSCIERIDTWRNRALSQVEKRSKTELEVDAYDIFYECLEVFKQFQWVSIETLPKPSILIDVCAKGKRYPDAQRVVQEAYETPYSVHPGEDYFIDSDRNRIPEVDFWMHRPSLPKDQE